MRLAAALLLLGLSGCDQAKWQGWVYPSASDLTDDIPIGRFATLEQCRASAKAILQRTEERLDEDREPVKGDYECGLNCKPDGGIGGLNVCDKTER